MTLETSVATAAQDQRQAAIGEAARHLYDAESALHIARQSGVGTWISAACDRLSEAIADHVRAVATLTGALDEDGLDHYAVGMKDPEGNEFDIN